MFLMTFQKTFCTSYIFCQFITLDQDFHFIYKRNVVPRIKWKNHGVKIQVVVWRKVRTHILVWVAGKICLQLISVNKIISLRYGAVRTAFVNWTAFALHFPFKTACIFIREVLLAWSHGWKLKGYTMHVWTLQPHENLRLVIKKFR